MNSVTRGVFLLSLLVMPVWPGTHSLAAELGKIKGRVMDEEGSPIPGANIIIVGTTFGAAANMDGYYFIFNVPVGDHVLNGVAIGFTSDTLRVRVSEKETAVRDLVLRSSPISMQELGVVSRGVITLERVVLVHASPPRQLVSFIVKNPGDRVSTLTRGDQVVVIDELMVRTLAEQSIWYKVESRPSVPPGFTIDDIKKVVGWIYGGKVGGPKTLIFSGGGK